ncbi:hypothetical protein Poli38472_012339 [Pythium oligandrum]|uniref:Uncharacterized protein n=1 Tax=Pythium oligandrum TaxID=41045 RepID=A0A8K1CRY0_PYTOL|nr:hypothetical protein Poli38472_012339 [Pythium oligandrum]|eukprot:TMW67223.1 hypothetical protein Poli38472_012339 [Pythium oligandrum]
MDTAVASAREDGAMTLLEQLGPHELTELMEVELCTTSPATSSYTSPSSPETSSAEISSDDAMDDGLYNDFARTSFEAGADAALMREMEELLANYKEDSQHWNQLHLESPSLMFAKPITPMGGAPTPVNVTSASLEQPVSPTTDEDTMDTDEGEDLTKQENNEMELLVRQLKFLEAQHEFLKYKFDLAVDATDHLSEEEQEERRVALEEKERLEHARLHHLWLANVAKEQMENLKYVELLLLQTPLNHYRMTLMTPMEIYVHLTRDPAERRATLLALRDEKIDAVSRFVEFQSRSIDVERQFFYLDTFEKFGKFFTVDFSISKLEATSVDEVATIIYNHYVTTNDTIAKVLGSVENREYFDGVEHTFLNARFVDRVNLPRRHKSDRGFVVQESNTVYWIKQVGETMVLGCEFVDKDDLHPYRQQGRIRKDCTVGILLQPHVDAHGKPCVIMKRFSFIRHHFKNITPTPDLLQTLSTKVILWGQAVRFCFSGRPHDEPTTPVIAAQLRVRSDEVTASLSP